jgi:multiple sugar transport system permease protein
MTTVTKSIGTRGSLFALSAPAVVFTLALIAFPFGYTIWLSLHEFSFGGTPRMNYGENYVLMVQDAEFWAGLKITLVLYVLSLVLQLVLGTYVAMLLHSAKRMSGVVRTLMISPFVLPPVVVGMMWLVVLDPSLGAANWLLESVGLPKSDWLASPQWVIPTVALIDTWQWTPYVALIVLGGLQSLPPNVYEAAQIDGASRWKTFWRITLPLLMPNLLVVLVLALIRAVQVFDEVYVLTGGGPGTSTMYLIQYIFETGFASQLRNPGLAAAASILMGAVLVVLTLMQLAASRSGEKRGRR